MTNAVEMAAWVEPEGKRAKFYHTSDVCKLRLDKTYIVLGDKREAIRKGMTLCPDCEKAND